MTDEIEQALAEVGYKSRLIRVTEEMLRYPAQEVVQQDTDFFSQMNFKMDYANKLCDDFDDPATLMRIAMQGISDYRETVQRTPPTSELGPEAIPAFAFIIRQLKRPEEVELLRKVYGRQFILISGYASAESRKEALEKKLKDTLPLTAKDFDIANKADRLIARDADEGSSSHGQHLRDTFHLADVFVDGIRRDRMRSGLDRFFQAFFGRADIGPSKSEYGMYAAKAASLRSSDLSRQVGAAIFSDDGEIITQGCNEVPKAFGGTYWDGEEPDHRDVKVGFDPNDHQKREVVRDMLERLEIAGLLKTDSLAEGSSHALVDIVLQKEGPHPFAGCLRDSWVAALTEFGRVVHAEMSAICDAARLGLSVKGGTLFCTTFPCHNCTKHILAAGIRRVIFMEPYPKSRAKDLHAHEIELEKASTSRVSFIPFLGISPYRYRDIFQKGSRKQDGKAVTWYYGEPRPMLEVSGPAYLETELYEVSTLGGSVQLKLV
jgi:deoxycytidylate deaminase